MTVLAQKQERSRTFATEVVAIWIDWYAYHIARFQGLLADPTLGGRVAGIEMVGGEGVHAGLRFKAELPPGLPVRTLSPGGSWRSASRWQLSRLLWQELTRLDAGAVMVPGYYTLPAIAAALWARSHDRISILMTESTASDHRRVWWKERLKSVVLRTLFDRAISGGSAHRRYLEQLHFPEKYVGRCYDVVDNDSIANEVEAVRLQRKPSDFDLPDRPYFLYVGRLAEEKNIGTLVSAWLAYRSDGGSWPLVLVGDGPARPELQSVLAQAGAPPSEVVFAGHRRADELAPFYAFAGCFVLPSTREPWGLVVNEAMAAALPILVSRNCGCAEDLVHESCNGFHFDPLSAQDLQHLLHRINSLAVEQRLHMGQTSGELIKAYSPQCFGAAIATLVST